MIISWCLFALALIVVDRLITAGCQVVGSAAFILSMLSQYDKINYQTKEGYFTVKSMKIEKE